MRLPGWAKFVFDAEVELLFAEREPDTAPLGKVRRLGDFTQAKDASVEAACDLLAAARHCQLDMVQAEDCRRFAHPASRKRSAVCRSTETSCETPRSAMVTPKRRLMRAMVIGLWVMVMNRVSVVRAISS